MPSPTRPLASVLRRDDPIDAALMRRVAAGDSQSFAKVYDRHSRAVFALAHRMLRERCAAEEVTQEVFVTLWRCRLAYRAERGSIRGWLLSITRNRAIDVMRRSRSGAHEQLDSDFDREAPDRTDEEALRRVEAVTIGAALLVLPDAQREAIELGYFDGLSQAEIAARLDISLGTIKGRTRLALRKLAVELSDAYAGTPGQTGAWPRSPTGAAV